MSRLAWLLPGVILGLLLGGCGAFLENPRLQNYDPAVGYRYDNLQPGDKNSDSLFVVLAFSGGGTRAASFSYGLLEALRDTEIVWQGQRKRLLDEVDIISSVSGGSFTAAYYALHRDGLFDGRFETEFLKKDIEKELLLRALSPLNWPKLAGFSYGRSDLAFDYYHQSLFDQATYAKLLERGSRPFLMVNATDMNLGSQFPFIQDQFDLICSDLSTFPLARAVASSSAFPGLLTPLTYKNYAADCRAEVQPPEWVELAKNDLRVTKERHGKAMQRLSYYARQPWQKPRPYLHLFDGGVADNIGLRSILFALETGDPAYSILSKVGFEEIEKLVVIVVNAATDPESKRDQSSSVPGVVDVLTTAAVVPLDNYSFDTVQRVQTALQEYRSGVELRTSCQAILDQKCLGVKLSSSLYEVDVYLSYIAFDYIPDPQTQFEFKNMPTTFKLSGEKVDDLRQIARQLLQDDPDFQKLLRELN